MPLPSPSPRIAFALTVTPRLARLRHPRNSLPPTLRACATPHSTPPPLHLPAPTQFSSSTTSTSSPPRDLDIVLTHSTADFDSLAAAVGLAKLRGPHTLVVTPAGESPALRRFLSLHRPLFKILGPKAVDPTRLRWLGIVDTVRSDRLGLAAHWPAYAQQVDVYDHHIGRVCDIEHPNLNLIVERVGAVATIIVERLRQHAIPLTPPEATLLALAIHSDTGSLTFEHTTSRDAAALAWLMSHGAIQRSISEFSHTLLSDEQQTVLSTALSNIKRHHVNGVEVASLLVRGSSFLKGMSTVANDVLEIANLDVLILMYLNSRTRTRKTKRSSPPSDQNNSQHTVKQVSIIGRARARVDGIDFSELFQSVGGGGHARAASASLKCTEEEAVQLLHRLINDACAQIPNPKPVRELMSRELVTVLPTSTISDARRLIVLHAHQILPVVNARGALLGLISMHDVESAERKRGVHAYQMPVAAWMHHNVISVGPDTPFYEAAKIVAEETMGVLPIVENGKLIGVLSRMDVLVARRLLPEDMLHSHRRWT